jgi:hypothetical protein
MEKCAKEECNKKATNKYCLKHQICLFVDETEAAGLKVCVNYIRGCRNQQDVTYKKKTCEDCLKKEREKDKERRKEVVETDEGTKSCKTCFQVYSIEHFQGIHGETLTCKLCRDANKRADEKRDKEHMNALARKNDKKPERIAVKKEWKEKNPEKCAKYWVDSYARKIEQDIEGVLKKNAENSKSWREANPEKVKEINQERMNSIHAQYGVYITTAKPRQLEFTITEDEFTDKVKSPCYYCGIIQEKGFNGIDRLDNTKGYIQDNCVGCCEICNKMKGSSGPNVFVHRVEHILTHLQIVQGNLYHTEFSDVKSVSYSSYIRGALDRELDFKIDEEIFYNKIKENCYLCGKNTNKIHTNGLDRFDNTKGYTEENIRSCCFNCNFMKKSHEYDTWINKLKMIYNYQNTNPIKENENKEIKQIVKGKKLTDEEKKNIQLERKKTQLIELKESYSSEDKRKERVEKIMKDRIEKK